MRRWYHWIISPRRSLLLWRADRQAMRQRELEELERRADEAVREAQEASAHAERHTLELELERLAAAAGPTCRYTFGADRSENPVLLFAAPRAGWLEARAVVAYGSIAHLEMTLEVTVGPETARLAELRRIDHSTGVGAALLQFTEPILREMGARRVEGSVHAADEEQLSRLIHFFRKNGYRLLVEGDTLTVVKELA